MSSCQLQIVFFLNFIRTQAGDLSAKHRQTVFDSKIFLHLPVLFALWRFKSDK